MVIALIGISGNAQGAPPPNRPTRINLPPLVRQSKPSCVVWALPTRSITARIGPPAFWASCASASPAWPSTVASAPALSAAKAGRALAAPEPGIGDRDVPDLQPALVALRDIGAEGDDLADGFMAHGARQRHAAVLQ